MIWTRFEPFGQVEFRQEKQKGGIKERVLFTSFVGTWEAEAEAEAEAEHVRKRKQGVDFGVLRFPLESTELKST